MKLLLVLFVGALNLAPAADLGVGWNFYSTKIKLLVTTGQVRIDFPENIETRIRVKTFLTEYDFKPGTVDETPVAGVDGIYLSGVGHFTIFVRPGHEKVWIEIMKSCGLVAPGTVPYTFAGVDTNIDRTAIVFNRLINKGSGYVSEQESVLPALLSAAIDYYDKRGHFKTLKNDKMHLKFEVGGMRREIIKAENYWESITMRLILASDGTVFVILDGYYASGLGSFPPATYTNMDGQYDKEMRSYVETTVTQLIDQAKQSR